jgi:hypothetical protein
VDRKDIVGDVGRAFEETRAWWLEMNEIFQIESRDVSFLELVLQRHEAILGRLCTLCI